MRDNDYAREIVTASIGDARIEKIFVKGTQQEEIRFSWWKNGKFQMRPLDLPETSLLELFDEAIRVGVFSDSFRRNLAGILNRSIT